MELRLREIHIGVSNLITENDVDRFAIESSFVAENPQTAIKLGQARGVAIAAAAVQDLTVAEYAPREIKQATVGIGARNEGAGPIHGQSALKPKGSARHG